MYYRIIDDCLSPNLCKELQEITNRSVIEIDNIDYDKQSSSLDIITNIIHNKRIIRCKISIFDIIEIHIEDHTNKKIDKVTLLFGFTIKDNSIYFSSAEEIQGITMYETLVKCKKYNFEIKEL